MAPEPDPTESEIAQATAAIRTTWSEAEHRKRSAWAVSERWTAPTITVDEDEAAGA